MKQYLIFGIYLILKQKGHCTAREIAEHFEVSTRSIYRYIDALNMAGVPIVSATGKYGGFEILSGFSLEKNENISKYLSPNPAHVKPEINT